MESEIEFAYNSHTQEAHHIPFVTDSCNTPEQISSAPVGVWSFYKNLAELRRKHGNAKFCGHCLGTALGE